MLYGTLEQQHDILEQAKQYADSEGIKLIFGAMVGSISKGLQYADSDYDTRFLYLRQDFPQKICIPSEMREEELVKRYYTKNKVYEWIPFWEATSFLQFLYNPSFQNDFSVGLYNIVGWTFLSPYVWDPYGLQSKIMPLVNQFFNIEYEVIYHRTIIEKYWKELECNIIISKTYLYSLHAAATIEWSIKYDMQPPIDLQTLLYGLNREDIWKEAQLILCNARKAVKENYKKGMVQLHDSHFAITTVYNKLIVEYVKYCYQLSEKLDIKDKNSKKNVANALINKIYQVIYTSVFEGEELLYGK